MTFMKYRTLAGVALVVTLGAASYLHAQAPAPIDDFFRLFTDDWVRMNPNQAISTFYGSGLDALFIGPYLLRKKR